MSIKDISAGSFIYSKPQALPDFLCQDMIARFERDSDLHYQGRVGSDQLDNAALKKTTDLAVTGNATWQDVENNLFRSLALALQEFREMQPYFAELRAFQTSGFNLQRYLPNEYYHWHVDADSPALAQRQLVALWYLNDVTKEQGGATEFRHQALNVQPTEGTLLLFPPFWTHEHRAATLHSGVKYIATTWVTFS